MEEILTKDKLHLKLFQDKVVINKKLPKWQHAENGLEKTKVPETNSTVYHNSNDSIRNYILADSDMSEINEQVNSLNSDVDSDVNFMPKWLPLYEVAEGISFDDLAKAGIKDLTRMIAENKLKFVIGGYGSLGNTKSSGEFVLSLNSNTDTLVTPEANSKKSYTSKSIISKIKSLLKNTLNQENDTSITTIDALEFFSKVKLSVKESVVTYRDRVSDYLKEVHNAVTVGQTALMEDLLRGLVTNKYESVLFAEGLYYVVTEEQIISFINNCEKGIKLDYIKNFTRPLPQNVVNKIEKINNLEVFDNYVVLYYDPDGKIYKETAREEAKRKDPIIFGVIAGSTKLYYIDDWIDEYCDLTLEKFIDTIGVKKEELHIDYSRMNKQKEEKTPTKKRKNRKRKINKNKENNKK